MVRKIEEGAELFTLEAWKKAIRSGRFITYDGSGRFVKDGEYLRDRAQWDEVFEIDRIPEEVTHIAWFKR